MPFKFSKLYILYILSSLKYEDWKSKWNWGFLEFVLNSSNSLWLPDMDTQTLGCRHDWSWVYLSSFIQTIAYFWALCNSISWSRKESSLHCHYRQIENNWNVCRVWPAPSRNILLRLWFRYSHPGSCVRTKARKYLLGGITQYLNGPYNWRDTCTRAKATKASKITQKSSRMEVWFQPKTKI